MLKGIDALLTPELLMHLCAMGHGEWVAVVDANFTARHLAQNRIPVVHLPGNSLQRVCQAVLSVLPLAQDVPHGAAYMQVAGSAPGHRTAAQEAVIAEVCAQGHAPSGIEAVERFAFYERVKAASLIVQTGETTAYGNVLFCKAVILP